MSYRLDIKESVFKSLEKMSKDIQTKIVMNIFSLDQNPRPHGCKKLRNRENEYRVRVGDYRVLYKINDNEITVYILKVGHRKDIYE